MEIQQVKLDFDPIPFLRKLDLIKQQAVKIVICSEDQAIIDIGLLQAKHQSEGQPGLRYHYVIKNNAEYDGVIYYCRPRIYQNGIPGQNDKGDNIVNNSISVCLAGVYGCTTTEKQTTSFVNLCVYLMSQEMLPLSSILSLDEMTQSALQFANWQDLKAKLKERIDNVNAMKSLIEVPTVNGVIDNTQFDQLISNMDLNNFAKVAKYTGVPETILIQMNKHLLYGENFSPNSVIYVPKSSLMQKIRSEQQIGVLQNSLSQLEEKVTYAETITRGKYGQPNTGKDLYSEDMSFLTTQYGGKKAPPWLSTGLEFPGYHNAFIQITNTNDGTITTIPFLVSPSSSSETRSSSQQITKTNAGWFIMRTGKNPTNLNISGYMMDAKDILEKHEFLEKYKKYIEDTRNARLEYINPYTVKIRLEGRDYHGYIQNISFNKAAVQPYLYQYNISFVILSDKMIYDARQAAVSTNTLNALINTGASPNTVLTGVIPASLQSSAAESASKSIGQTMYDTFKDKGINLNDVHKMLLANPTPGKQSGTKTV